MQAARLARRAQSAARRCAPRRRGGAYVPAIEIAAALARLLQGDYSLVELPADLPAATLQALRKARVGGQMLRLERAGDGEDVRTTAAPRRAPPRGGSGAPRKPGGLHKPRPPRG